MLQHVRPGHGGGAQQVGVVPAQLPDGLCPRTIVPRRGLLAPQAGLHRAHRPRHRFDPLEEAGRGLGVGHHARQHVPH
eukprot:3571702-Pyramimonas_sp.AAC.1